MGAQWVAFKDSVRLSAIDDEIIIKMVFVAQISAPRLVENTMVVTAIEDGQHSPASCHFSRSAIDIRTHGDRAGGIASTDVDGEAKLWVKRISRRLGRDYNVIYEKDKTHIHIEFDLVQGSEQ